MTVVYAWMASWPLYSAADFFFFECCSWRSFNQTCAQMCATHENGHPQFRGPFLANVGTKSCL